MSYKKGPLVRAERIPRTGNAHLLPAGGNIAAVDFGTTSVSLAYSTIGDNTVNTFKFETKERVPNAILLKRADEKGSREIGGPMTVEAFGTAAQLKFTTMRGSQYENYIYFERIKMLMKRDKVSDSSVIKCLTLIAFVEDKQTDCCSVILRRNLLPCRGDCVHIETC